MSSAPWEKEEWSDQVAKLCMYAHELCKGDPIAVALLTQTCASASAAFVHAMCPPEIVVELRRQQDILTNDLLTVDSLMAPRATA